MENSGRHGGEGGARARGWWDWRASGCRKPSQMHKRAYMDPYSHDVGRILEGIGREGGARARGRWNWGALRLKPGKKNKRATCTYVLFSML